MSPIQSSAGAGTGTARGSAEIRCGSSATKGETGVVGAGAASAGADVGGTPTVSGGASEPDDSVAGGSVGAVGGGDPITAGSTNVTGCADGARISRAVTPSAPAPTSRPAPRRTAVGRV